MVIRKCLVYNLDLFAFKRFFPCAVVRIVVVKASENSKVEKDLWV